MTLLPSAAARSTAERRKAASRSRTSGARSPVARACVATPARSRRSTSRIAWLFKPEYEKKSGSSRRVEGRLLLDYGEAGENVQLRLYRRTFGGGATLVGEGTTRVVQAQVPDG